MKRVDGHKNKWVKCINNTFYGSHWWVAYYTFVIRLFILQKTLVMFTCSKVQSRKGVGY